MSIKDIIKIKKLIGVAMFAVLLVAALCALAVYSTQRSEHTVIEDTTEEDAVDVVAGEEEVTEDLTPVPYTLTAPYAGNYISISLDVKQTRFDLETLTAYYITDDFIIVVSDSGTATIISSGNEKVIASMPNAYMQRTEDISSPNDASSVSTDISTTDATAVTDALTPANPVESVDNVADAEITEEGNND